MAWRNVNGWALAANAGGQPVAQKKRQLKRSRKAMAKCENVANEAE